MLAMKNTGSTTMTHDNGLTLISNTTIAVASQVNMNVVAFIHVRFVIAVIRKAFSVGDKTLDYARCDVLKGGIKEKFIK